MNASRGIPFDPPREKASVEAAIEFLVSTLRIFARKLPSETFTEVEQEAAREALRRIGRSW